MDSYTPIQMEIARQVHNAKPAHLVPGKHVGFEPVGTLSLEVTIRHELAPSLTMVTRSVTVTYNEGADLYDVEVAGVEPMHGIYCDQLGELVFDGDAVPWSEPMVMLSTDEGETWEILG